MLKSALRRRTLEDMTTTPPFASDGLVCALVLTRRYYTKRKEVASSEIDRRRAKKMSDVVVQTPMQYLDRAMGALRNLGLMQAKTEERPCGLLEKITDLDPDKITVITRTLGQMSVLTRSCREQISADGDRTALRTDHAELQFLRDEPPSGC